MKNDSYCGWLRNPFRTAQETKDDFRFPANTNIPWFPVVSKWCRISSIHSRSSSGVVERIESVGTHCLLHLFFSGGTLPTQKRVRKGTGKPRTRRKPTSPMVPFKDIPRCIPNTQAHSLLGTSKKKSGKYCLPLRWSGRRNLVDVGRGATKYVLAVKWGFPTKPQ